MDAPVKPPRLRTGDLVAAAAPSGPFADASVAAGAAVVAARGLEVRPPAPRSRRGFLAGTDDERLREFEALWRDPAVRAVWCVRGGYGAMRLLDRLPPAPPAPPKLLVGFSDVTALHAWAARGRPPLATIHGPLLTTLAAEPPETRAHLFALLGEPAPPPPIRAGRGIVGGRAGGVLCGGNLSVFTRLLGTPWFPDLRGTVLFLEDVGERPYRLDRMVQHLRLARVLDGVRALVLGRFLDCEDPPRMDYTASGKPQAHAAWPDAGEVVGSAEVVAELARALGVPALADFPAGHGAPNFALPLGCHVTVDADRGELVFDEGAVS